MTYPNGNRNIRNIYQDDSISGDASNAVPDYSGAYNTVPDYSGAGQAGEAALMRSYEGSAVPIVKPIGKEQIQTAWNELMKYKQNKANLEQRIIDDQQWYKLRQWECMRRKQKKNEVEPSSAWLFNAIVNKHADAMDAFPRPNILPREQGDVQEAKILSSIIPVIFDNCNFEKTFSKVMDDKFISGTGAYGVFWDNTKLNGLGDIDIEEIDVINLFWESGVEDIQQSRNLFYVTLRDNDLLEQEYPELMNKLSAPVMDVGQYVYDDNVDTTQKSVVVDWYYKKIVNGKTVLHYCKFVGGQDNPLFATENDEEYRERGWYDHGKYPFIFDPLFGCKGTPCGFGYVDVGKGAQEYIDRGDQAVMQNMLFNAKPRHFIRSDGSVNEMEYADTSKDFIHVDGSLGDDSISPVRPNPLNEVYITILNNKINELKETTGNRDVSTGGTTGGATAAAAIAAMQEAGSKLSRDSSKAAYRAYREVVLMVIELIRQFYDTVRCFRIIGENGAQDFVNYSNSNLVPQSQSLVDGSSSEFGVEVGSRLPLFDVEVTAEKASPYTKMSQNELALQLYGNGFFNPSNAEAALACLSMMDFDRKEDVVKNISQNSLMVQQFKTVVAAAMSFAQQLDAIKGTNNAAQLAQSLGITAQAGTQLPQGGADGKLSADTKESKITSKARAQTAEASAPR